MSTISTTKSSDWNATMRQGSNSQPSAFNPLSVNGNHYYSGTDVRIFFDDIEIEEFDAIGFQMSQNVRPIYGYHSHVLNAVQYGTKLVQGYFQLHISHAGYLAAILTTIELQRRKVQTPALVSATNSLQNIMTGVPSNLGTTFDSALSQLSTSPNWSQIADAYTKQAFPGQQQETTTGSSGAQNFSVRGLFPPEPMGNFFTFNPAGTTLADRGFTITVVYGNTEFGSKPELDPEGKLVTHDGSTFPGTLHRIYEAHIIAGPNSQISSDKGDPIPELFTFIAKDIV